MSMTTIRWPGLSRPEKPRGAPGGASLPSLKYSPGRSDWRVTRLRMPLGCRIASSGTASGRRYMGRIRPLPSSSVPLVIARAATGTAMVPGGRTGAAGAGGALLRVKNQIAAPSTSTAAPASGRIIGFWPARRRGVGEAMGRSSKEWGGRPCAQEQA